MLILLWSQLKTGLRSSRYFGYTVLDSRSNPACSIDLRCTTKGINMKEFVTNAGDKLMVHSLEDCRGPVCPIHKPTPHHMREWKMIWRGDRQIFERLCEHGIGHPDPDDQ